ncbi:MAG: hypothetical protein JW953_03180, partial [Anaerolineae bacterium]|nr:hypothetical protein [Anaerolineae bacterium]
MVRSRSLPKYKYDLAGFVGMLRQQVFSSQAKAAAHFHLHRTTIVRYERGELAPPLGYLACLVGLCIDQLTLAGEKEVEDCQQTFLKEANRAIHHDYQDLPFQNWGELCAVADEYLAKRRSIDHPLDTSTTQATNQNIRAETAFALDDLRQGIVGATRPCLRDWGEAPDVSMFYGRQKELAELERWIVDDHCRLVGVLGLGGIGKTALTAKLVEQVKHRFDYIIWRSLRNAPPVKDILNECFQILSNQPQDDTAGSVNRSISRLVDCLGRHRCLLVLDNAEAILQEGEWAGHYQPGYEDYGELLRRAGQTNHQSCLILTSREKPGEFAPLEGEVSPVRSRQLTGLGQTEGRKILKDKGLSGPDEAWAALIHRYSGN